MITSFTTQSPLFAPLTEDQSQCYIHHWKMPCLSDILGQDAALTVLQRALTAHKLAQAYLFHGPQGVGKKKSAIALAAALNCLDRPEKGCATCLSCHKINQGLHPDVIQLLPDGASIKIDQVRALEQNLGYPPHEGRYRVVIIDGAEHLNPYAANALLKSVEEPRPATLFVLVCAAMHRLLPTLVSRCQRIRFLPLSASTLLTILQQHTAQPVEEQQTAAALAEGSAGRALALLESEQTAGLQKRLSSLLDAAKQGSVVNIFSATNQLGKDRSGLIELLDLWKTWLRDLLLVSEGLDQGRLINSERRAQLHAEAQDCQYRTVIRQLKAVNEAQAALSGNVNPALVMENLLLNLRQAACS